MILSIVYGFERPCLLSQISRKLRQITKFFTLTAETDFPASQSLESRFNAIVMEHNDMITRICFGYATDNNELQDLRQDTLLNIWQSLSSFKGNSSLRTWIYRITLNTCVSTIRKRKSGKSLSFDDNLYSIIDESEERKRMIAEMHEGISKLSPVDKAIILMWLDEMSYDVIADVMGMPRNTIATRLKRAKEKLKNI